MRLRVYIGYDKREAPAARVAAKSLYQICRIKAEELHITRLQENGVVTRLADRRGEGYQHYDLVSNARASTDFAFSRFLVPILCQGGFALGVDCDVVFLRNPIEMLSAGVDENKAVHVVKHAPLPPAGGKMDGQAQTAYPRKNWSSVILWNTDHPANRRLTLHDVNTRSGLWLHQFGWLHDDEIGELDPAWNWLVDVNPRPAHAGIAHMTLGGPWIPGWAGGSFDKEWERRAR